jgi:hypothetical protein
MLRIVYSSTEIIQIVNNDPTMGTTYTVYNVIVCSESEAYDFFIDYPQEEIDKITNFIQNGDSLTTVKVIDI